MQQLTTTATFTDRRPDDDVLTTIVARSVLEAALAEDEKAELWFEIGREDDATTRLAIDLSAADLDAMRKEMKRRKDAPLTARVTENRQYRFWDHPLAEGVADKLVAIDAETGGFQRLEQ